MLEDIHFTLSAPICKCHYNDLGWGLTTHELYFRCRTCGAKLIIPTEKLRAGIEAPYPQGVKQKDNILHLIKGKKDGL